MTKFARASAYPDVVTMTIGVTIHVTRADLDRAHTTGEVFALANEKKAEAIDALNRSMMALAIEIEGSRRLFAQIESRDDKPSAAQSEGAPV